MLKKTTRKRVTQQRIDLVKALLDDDRSALEVSKILKMSTQTIDHIVRSSFDFETYAKIPRILTTEAINDSDTDEKFDIILNLLMECLDILNTQKPLNKFDTNKQMSVNGLDLAGKVPEGMVDKRWVRSLNDLLVLPG